MSSFLLLWINKLPISGLHMLMVWENTPDGGPGGGDQPPLVVFPPITIHWEEWYHGHISNAANHRRNITVCVAFGADSQRLEFGWAKLSESYSADKDFQDDRLFLRFKGAGGPQLIRSYASSNCAGHVHLCSASTIVSTTWEAKPSFCTFKIAMNGIMVVDTYKLDDETPRI